MRSKRRGQAVVEFGIIALLFTLMMFAVVDFGLLLNTWLAVSAGSRDIARNAAVGKKQPELQAQALHLNLPSVSNAGFPTQCCDNLSALEVQVYYYRPICPPWQTACQPIVDQLKVSKDYPFVDLDDIGGVDPATCSITPDCHPKSDDIVTITVIAHGAQVITPLVRPFFGCTDGTVAVCKVALSSTTIMRFEGQEF